MLVWLVRGVGRQTAQGIVGCLSYSFLFRRNLLACLGGVYAYVRRSRGRVRPRGFVADELVAAGFLQLMAVANARWPLSQTVAVSDASLVAAGGAWAVVPADVAALLFDLSEARGGSVLLEEVAGSTPEQLQDHRLELALLVCQAPWKIAFCFLFHSSGHI